MSTPKVELISEGLRHTLRINGVDMGKMVRKAVITIEANDIVSYALTFGGSAPEAFPEIESTTVSSESREYIAPQA